MKKRFTYIEIYLIGITIIAIGFVFVGLVDKLYLFFLTAPVLGFGGGIMMTNINAWMLSVAHHSKRVKSSGYLTSSLFLGQFFSPVLTMPIVANFGVQYFFIVVGIILFTSVFIALLLKKK